MKIFNNFIIPKKYKRSSLAIGNFDGVHKGHQKIFKNAGKKQIIHGLLDFNHLSKSGYELLSDSIIQSFFNGDSIQLGCYSS